MDKNPPIPDKRTLPVDIKWSRLKSEKHLIKKIGKQLILIDEFIYILIYSCWGLLQ